MFKKNGNFIERSIVAALSFLKDSIFAEAYACQKGLLQVLDDRIRVSVLLLWILLVLLVKEIHILVWIYGMCLALALLSRIRPGYFLARTWIFIPIFSLFIAIPSVFSAFSPGQALLTFNLFGQKLIITQQGLSGAVLFVLRVVNSVSLSVLLVLTTKHSRLLDVLRFFKVPLVFVMTLGMCYRYLYLFVSVVENTYKAIQSRVGLKVHYKKGQNIVAWNLASLWHRSYELHHQVYEAMRSRGYRYE